MKTFVLAGLFTVVMASPAFAESYYIVKDTVGNCASVITTPAGAPGLKVISHKSYATIKAANKAMDALPKSDCAGLVQ